MVEFQNILDDFEELLIRGFRENALITPDTLVGVEAAYELVSHYADEKVKLDSVSMLRFGELSFFNELYRLQSGLVLGSEHPGFDEVLKHVTISNQLVRLGDEFIRLLKLGEAGRTISIQEFENLNMPVSYTHLTLPTKA